METNYEWVVDLELNDDELPGEAAFEVVRALTANLNVSIESEPYPPDGINVQWPSWRVHGSLPVLLELIARHSCFCGIDDSIEFVPVPYLS